MKYFTPTLVNEMFTDDAAAVDERFGVACDSYDDHLANIEDRLPPAARNLAIRLGLYGGRVLFHAQGLDAYHFAVRLADEQMGELLCVLEYDLEGRAPKVIYNDGPGFVEGQVNWLYDEWDITDGGSFVHRVLFTDGTEIELTFKTLAVTWAKIEEN